MTGQHPLTAGRSVVALLLALLTALTISGYPLVGMLGDFLGLEALFVSVPFRVAVVALGVLGMFEVLRTLRPFRLDILLLLFWWLYVVRLVFDLGNPAFEDTVEALIFFVATCLIPSIAAMTMANSYSEKSVAQLLFLLGVAVSAGMLLLLVTGNLDQDLLKNQGGRVSIQAVNAISLGHVYATGIIAGLVLWRHHRTLYGGRLLLAAGSVLNAVALVMAGSRGPLLALVVALIAFAVMRGRWGQIFAGGLALAMVLPNLIASQSLTLIDRFLGIYVDASSQERLIYQASAIEQAVTHPLFGSGYVELLSGTYPHNLAIESAMAMGLVGFALFLFLSVKGSVQAISRLRRGEVLLPLLFIQYLIASQLSGALWGAASLWIVMSLLAVLPSASDQPGKGRSASL